MLFCLFFFKQKTAYEMRISDWSSDVCSSDLIDIIADGQRHDARLAGLCGRRRARHRRTLPFERADRRGRSRERQIGDLLPLVAAVDAGIDSKVGVGAGQQRLRRRVERAAEERKSVV